MREGSYLREEESTDHKETLMSVNAIGCAGSVGENYETFA